jgi:hypothetical protein
MREEQYAYSATDLRDRDYRTRISASTPVSNSNANISLSDHSIPALHRVKAPCNAVSLVGAPAPVSSRAGGISISVHSASVRDRQILQDVSLWISVVIVLVPSTPEPIEHRCTNERDRSCKAILRGSRWSLCSYHQLPS